MDIHNPSNETIIKDDAVLKHIHSIVAPHATLVTTRAKRKKDTLQRTVSWLDWSAIAAFSLPFLLYWLTAAPTIYNLDSAEFTTAVATNGLIRATGYPLYLLLGKLWLWLPLGTDMGYRLNLLSAFCGAMTILLGERILRRLGVSSWARLAALGLLATAPFFWALSLIAEVYTLHTALMAGVILALMRWAAAPTAWRFALSVFLMALSLGNHAATVLLIPGCIWFVLTQHPRKVLQPHMLLIGMGALLLGTAVFLLLPLRYASQPTFNYAGLYDSFGVFHPINLQTWSGFWQLISGQTFAGQMFGYHLTDLGPQVVTYVSQLWRAFFAIGIGPGIVGMVVLWRRDWRLNGLLSLMFLANAIFYINYRVVDKETMFLPTYLIFAIWVGIGCQWLLNEVMPNPKKTETLASVKLNTFVPLCIMLIVALPVGANWRQVDLSDDWSTRQQSELILQQAEPNALIFGWWETVPAIQYLQLVEGQRPDITVINRFLISAEDMNRLITNAVNQRPVYINNPSIALLRETTATAVGPLYRLEPQKPAVIDPHKTVMEQQN
ncbi:MAG: DUF2723 domain-containing protein [Anaerolineales bacterium]|nr:DUF2723 domain-containing protein [Anaerolineales bacterium]